MNQQTLVMFGLFVAITLIITYWASGRSTTARGFYAAHRSISGIQNGWAIAGDYVSAAAFLGITGLIAFFGFDGFIYCVGWLLAYLVVLFIIAEPMRNLGKYTLVDVMSFRLRGRGVRAIAAISTLFITLFYMVAQMVGAGSLIAALLPQIGYNWSLVIVGILMLTYVFFGGMLATTWVQIIKAGLLLSTSLGLTLMVLDHYGFSIVAFLSAASHAPVDGTPVNLLRPGLLFHVSHDALNTVSLGIALILGTAGLPHILMRFFTVPTAKAARTSVAWAMVLIGAFYLATAVIGLGAATIVGKAHIGIHLTDTQAIRYIAHHPEAQDRLNAEFGENGYLVPTVNNNLAAPVLAEQLGGPLLNAFVSAVVFATSLAVAGGLTIAASSAFAHDIWRNLIRKDMGDDREFLLAARTSALFVGLISLLIAVVLPTLNVAVLMGLAFAVAASANVPVLVLSLWWKRFSRNGAIVGLLTGLISSLGLIAISPPILGTHAIFPLDNPGIVSVPLGFLGAIIGALVSRDPESEAMFQQLQVRANTGLGAEL